MVSVENLCYSDRPLISTQEGIANSADPVHLSEEWLPTQKSDSPPLLSRLVAGLILAGHSLMSVAQAGHKPWGPGHGTSLTNSVCC